MGVVQQPRKTEKAALSKRIQTIQHTVLVALRRYGKTSLVLNVIADLKWPYCNVDLLTAYDCEYVRQHLLDHIGKLAFALLPKTRQASQVLLKIFAGMKPELTITALGQQLKLSWFHDPLQDVTQALLKLNETARHFKKKAVIFIDEFQQISLFQHYQALEGAIRHAVERSDHIAYIFSGSNRQLLIQMFGDKSRPLYRLCQVLTIERMGTEAYRTRFQKLAKQRWQATLSAETIDTILTLTDHHPFYTNVFCQQLWENPSLPTPESTIQDWHAFVLTQRHLIVQDIVLLSGNQKKILIALAEKPSDQVLSAHFTGRLHLSASSTKQAITALLQKDLIYRNTHDQYAVLDPAICYYLSHFL